MCEGLHWSAVWGLRGGLLHKWHQWLPALFLRLIRCSEPPLWQVRLLFQFPREGSLWQKSQFVLSTQLKRDNSFLCCVSLVNQISFVYIFTAFLTNCGIKRTCQLYLCIEYKGGCILAFFQLVLVQPYCLLQQWPAEIDVYIAQNHIASIYQVKLGILLTGEGQNRESQFWSCFGVKHGFLTVVCINRQQLWWIWHKNAEPDKQVNYYFFPVYIITA